jgi:hypothetical protein
MRAHAVRDVSRAPGASCRQLSGCDLPRVRRTDGPWHEVLLRAVPRAAVPGVSALCEPAWAAVPLCRQRRPLRTTAFHVTTSDHVIALFNACHAKAIRLAQYVGDLNQPAAEDVVSEVFLWIWMHRDYFPAPPGPALLLHVVTRAALRVHRYAWARYVVAMDPPTLVLAEQATYDPTSPAIAVPL